MGLHIFYWCVVVLNKRQQLSVSRS